MSGANIVRILTDEPKAPEHVAALAEQYGVPVSLVEVAEPTPLKECVTIKSSTENRATRPDVELEKSLKQQYADVMRELRAMATRQASVDESAWNELLAKRIRTLYFFISRTNGEWSDLHDGGDDELARQDEQLFGLFRRAEHEHDKLTFPTGITATEIANRFYPRGTGWPAFLDEVRFWCKESGDAKAVAGAVANIRNERSAATLSVPEAVQTYAACDGSVNARDYTARIDLLARRVISATPGSAQSELRDEVAKLTTAIGVPALTDDLATTLVSTAKQQVREEVAQKRRELEGADTEIARLGEQVKARCDGFGEDMLAVKRTQSTIDNDWAKANRACNEYQMNVENTDPIVSKYTTKDGTLTAWRRDVLPGLKATNSDCIERERLTKQKEAVSRCISALEQKASAIEQKAKATQRLETLLREFKDVN